MIAALLALASVSYGLNLCPCTSPAPPQPPVPPFPPVAPVPIPPSPPVCPAKCQSITLGGTCQKADDGCNAPTYYKATGDSKSVKMEVFAEAACTTSVANMTVTTTCTNGIKIGSCFSDNDFVTMQDGSKKSVADVKAGDMVLTARSDRTLGYDRVFRITMASEGEATFLKIKTAAGSAIELSEGHMIPVGDVALDALKLAEHVTVGDVVFVVDEETKKARPSVVTSIERVTRKGLHNFHTTSGVVVVNGVVGSHFTVESTWSNRKMAVFWYKLLDIMPSSVRALLDGPTDVRA